MFLTPQELRDLVSDNKMPEKIMEHPLGEESLEIDKTALYGIKRIPRLPSVDEVR